jgi:hypothetical protein
MLSCLVKVAYAAIVFRHPAYAAYIDPLSKMFFLSSAIHQAVFCLLSSLPFAMGQVQDVGKFDAVRVIQVWHHSGCLFINAYFLAQGKGMTPVSCIQASYSYRPWVPQ